LECRLLLGRLSSHWRSPGVFLKRPSTAWLFG
jgi:hypothetical protein